MTRDEFKRHLKASVHIGTGQTRKRDKQADSAEIELLTRDFLANGGQIQELASEQQRPYRSPAFNPGDIGGEA
ncbi:MAG: hypothetical protein VX555_01775 [Pseudomonadota bacterium]|nr:hypothetical protein [Pseudomonadota bacterium]